MKFFFTIYLLFCYLLINATQSSDMTLISARTIGTDSSCGHTDNTEINRDTIYTQIHFRQGYSRLDTNFSDNNIRLRHLTSLLDSIASAPTVRLKSVSIKGSASPEGPSDLNRRLSERRALSAREYILSHTNLPDSIVTILPSDVDWEMLHTLVTDTDMPWRDEVLDIISHTPIWIFQGKRIVGGRKKQLQDLNGGRAWEYMSEHLFPTMHNAHYRIIYEWETVEPIPCENMPEANADSLSMATQSFTDTVDSPLSHASGTTYATDITPSAKIRPDFTILLKTNLLYDAALTPNIGVEIPIGKHLSAEANWMYARWNKASVHKYWRIYGGDLSLYTRLGRLHSYSDRFAGHFIGLYGQMAVYDFQFGERKGVLSDKWNYAVGIVYKYSLPVARRLYIECSLGVGYLWGTYKKHRPIDECDVWLSTHRLHWLVPTRAGISLIWLIGKPACNKYTKGGER